MTNLINVMHQGPFGLLFINYSLLLGVAGGIGISWALDSHADSFKKFRQPLLLALIFSIGAILNVLAEVNQQGRLIYGVIYGWEHWYGSVIKYGVITIPLYIGILIVALFVKNLSQTQLTLLKALTFIVGSFLAAYSGIFMMNEHGIALWNTPLSPVVTLLTGVASGLFVYAMTTRHIREQAIKIAAALAFFSLFIVLLATWWGSLFAGVEVAQSLKLIANNFSNMALLGLAASLLAIVVGFIARCNKAKTVAMLLVIVASYIVRYLLVAGGEGASQNGGGFTVLTPDTHEYFYSAASIIFMWGFYSLSQLIFSYYPAINIASSNRASVTRANGSK